MVALLAPAGRTRVNMPPASIPEAVNVIGVAALQAMRDGSSDS